MQYQFSAFWEAFLAGIHQTGAIEYIAVFAGIISVYFSKKESIWVYPIGLINTILFTFLSVKGQLFGEASVNIFYTLMSVYGWWNWSRKTNPTQPFLQISYSSRKEIILQIAFFASFYFVLFLLLKYVQKSFAPGAIPFADAFASATAYTGMWLMTKKKVESWYWWIATNVVSIPLYFMKGYVFTSVQFFVLLILAIAGWVEWRNRYKQMVSNH